MDKDIGNMVSSVLSNPELLNKISDIVKNNKDGDISDALPKVVEAISGNKEDIKSEESAEEKTEEASKKWLDVSKLDKYTQTKNVALLRSLKPFMSKSRCDMIDNILRLEQLAEIVKLTR